VLALLGLSTIASLTVSLVLGVRLLRLWGRSRQLPELTIGASFLTAGVLAITVIPLSGDAAGSTPTQLSPLTVLGDATRMGAGAWGAFESLRYFTLMRRRLRIGLAEPAVTNRFLLWGIATLTTSGIFFATSTLMRLQFAPKDAALTPELMIIVSLGTVGAAIVQWLAFIPPAFYLRWIEGRAPAAESTA